ncbi:hypothetical protein QA584_22990 [Anaerocolumna sp. AGMB13025]|uniref:hypothetical protein n=1 Tax=Anaerocolumna sp. AGMB13025 TaxID=3039116 RepID=UPI00241EF0D4|nr:hypothetical protein [Anaerocolumna sp. AGMB13025]WFR56450.1 hypothetical protein QA584_22990 [Anaerocolumna sp. AGMB13025]
MKKQQKNLYITLFVLGVILLVSGFLIISEDYSNISGLCIGIGIGLMAMSFSNLVINNYYQKRPVLKRQNEINSKDERNTTITNRAKAKAFDWTIRLLIVFPFLLIFFKSPLWMIFSVIGIYLLGFSIQVFYTIRFNNEM